MLSSSCTHTENITMVADWQIWGDVDAETVITEYLQEAVDRGELTAFEILLVSGGGAFSLKYVAFMAFAEFEFEDLVKPKKRARRLLNRVVHDTDVKVRWVKRTCD